MVASKFGASAWLARGEFSILPGFHFGVWKDDLNRWKPLTREMRIWKSNAIVDDLERRAFWRERGIPVSEAEGAKSRQFSPQRQSRFYPNEGRLQAAVVSTTIEQASGGL